MNPIGGKGIITILMIWLGFLGDINGYDKVDTKDITLVAKNYRKTCHSKSKDGDETKGKSVSAALAAVSIVSF